MFKFKRSNILGLLLALLPLNGYAAITNDDAKTNAKLSGDDMQGCVTIGQITIDSLDVFQGKKKRNLIYDAMDLFNYRTQNKVIKKELLFKEGECYQPELVEESERNLRNFDILAEVIFEVTKTSDNTVDIHIISRDHFTLRAEVSVSRAGGENRSRVSFGEKNFFGLNKELHFTRSRYDDNSESEVDSYVYIDKRFFKQYSVLGIYTDEGSGALQRYNISKPFRTLESRSSYGLAYLENETDIVYYTGEGKNCDIPAYFERKSFFTSREMGTRDESNRPGFLISQAYSQSAPPLTSCDGLPSLRYTEGLDKAEVRVGYSWTSREDFLVRRGVDSLTSKEDIEIKTSYSFDLGVEAREELANNVLLDAELEKQNHLVTSVSTYRSRFISESFLTSYNYTGSYRFYAEHLREAKVDAFARAYYFFSNARAAVAGISFEHRRVKDELDAPVTVGGEFGLRGFDNNAFAGNKRLIANVELRDDLPSPSSDAFLGYAFFVDTGYAWDEFDEMQLRDLQTNVGWGLRVQVPALFGPKVVRVDLASQIRSGDMSLTVTLGQVFDYDKSNFVKIYNEQGHLN